ncbi:MAG TPA: hypothetical protein VIP11_23695 [Gemmatimonadaceae bacterium]
MAEQHGLEELSSLNVDDLDVEELEQRLEMAAALDDCDCWVNGCTGYCVKPAE